MNRMLTIIAISLCYFVFAVLLNSVGTVILQSITTFDVSKTDASTLEGFKDLSIAFVSFFIASFIPRIGYQVALCLGLVLVAVVCLLTPLFAEFYFIKVLFAAIGTAFALVKISVYSLIGQLSSNTKTHSSLMNTVEGIFMVGVLSGYWIFSGFIDPNDPASLAWLNVYYLLGGMITIAAIFVYFVPIEREPFTGAQTGALSEFLDMLKLTYQPLVLMFVISVFLYVLVEQGIGSWLPTFNREVLGLPVDISIQLTSIFAAMIAIGRLLAGFLLRFVPWYIFINGCLVMMFLTILLTLPMTQVSESQVVTGIFDAPLAAYLLPAIGLFMAPIYPLINSVVLSALPNKQHAKMTGLIVIFSALGGTFGSILTGVIFEKFGGQHAFYMSLIPIVMIMFSLFIFKKLSANRRSTLVKGA